MRRPRLATGTAAGVVGAVAVIAFGSAEASSAEVIGHSVGGRPIKAVQLGDPAGTRTVLLVGVIHGDERAGLRISAAVRRLAAAERGALAGTQLWLIPTVNPDGVRMHARKNGRGVDLNRNFPFRWRDRVPPSSGYYPGRRPASEPETRALMSFVQRTQPTLSIWWHQPWGAVLACRGQPPAAARYATLVGMRTSCRGNGLRGTAVSWEESVLPGAQAFVVELPGGGTSAQTNARHARAALTLAEGD